MKMNFTLTLLSVFVALLAATSCKKVRDRELGLEDVSVPNNVSLLNITDPNDPNLNPNWEWWNYQPHTLYYSPTGTNNNISPISTYLPYFSQGNILNTGTELDMSKADGWVLAFKDFGTPTRAIDFPFFALYNKYRGIFRVMLYNAPRVSGTYFKADLSFVHQSNTAGIFTFNTTGNASFLNSYDRGVIEHQIAAADGYSGWLVFDFNLAGYDPSISTNAALRLRIHRVDETSLNINSTEFQLNEYINHASPGGQGSSFSNAINTGHNIYKSYDDMKKGLKESGFFSNDFFSSSYLGAIPIIGSALGVIKTFIGGKSKPAPRQPLSFRGSLRLEGVATTGQPIYSRDFALSQASSVLSDYKPLNAISWGLFAIRSIPTFNYVTTNGFDAGCNWYASATATLAAPIDFVSNHVANGMTLTRARVGIITNLPNDPATRFGESLASHTETRPLNYGELADNFYNGKEIGIQLTYHINNPTNHLDREIVIYKVYPAIYINRGEVREDHCDNGGSGIIW